MGFISIIFKKGQTSNWSMQKEFSLKESLNHIFFCGKKQSYNSDQSSKVRYTDKKWNHFVPTLSTFKMLFSLVHCQLFFSHTHLLIVNRNQKITPPKGTKINLTPLCCVNIKLLTAKYMYLTTKKHPLGNEAYVSSNLEIFYDLRIIKIVVKFMSIRKKYSLRTLDFSNRSM